MYSIAPCCLTPSGEDASSVCPLIEYEMLMIDYLVDLLLALDLKPTIKLLGGVCNVKQLMLDRIWY